LPTAIHPSPHLANPFWYIRVIRKERKKHSMKNHEFGHTWVRFKNNMQKTPKTLSFGGKVSVFYPVLPFPWARLLHGVSFFWFCDVANRWLSFRMWFCQIWPPVLICK
jgi:hypothetical protein